MASDTGTGRLAMTSHDGGTVDAAAVGDPHRWLDGDPRADARVRDWVAAQDAAARAELAALPGHDAFARRVRDLDDYERTGVPVRRGGRLFHRHRPAGASRSRLVVRDGVEGAPRVLVDPGEDGLGVWAPSADGTQVAYVVVAAADARQTVRVRSVADGRDTGDVVDDVATASLAWAGNGAGFFYARFGDGGAAGVDHGIRFHRLGTPQSADRLVHATPDRPRLLHRAEVTEDGSRLLVTTHDGDPARCELVVIDLTAPRIVPRTLVRGLEQGWRLAGSIGDVFYLLTDSEAARGRIVAMDVTSEMRRLREVVPEGAATITAARLVGGDRLLLATAHGGAASLSLYDVQGHRLAETAGPAGSGIADLAARADGTDAWYARTWPDRPAQVRRIDVATQDDRAFAVSVPGFDPDRFTVDHLGAAVLLRARGIDGPRPTVLRIDAAAGAIPGVSAAALAWAEAGGVWATAAVAGSVEALLAVAADLAARGGAVALWAEGAGASLAAAAIVRRPDLFAAAVFVDGRYEPSAGSAAVATLVVAADRRAAAHGFRYAAAVREIASPCLLRTVADDADMLAFAAWRTGLRL